MPTFKIQPKNLVKKIFRILMHRFCRNSGNSLKILQPDQTVFPRIVTYSPALPPDSFPVSCEFFQK